MRKRWALSVVLMTGSVTTAPAQTSVPFTLNLTGPGTVSAGQPVPVRVLLQNTSDHKISCMAPKAILMDGEVLSIQGPSGQELPPKGGEWSFSGGVNVVAPGAISDDVLRVDRWYDLNRPGRYTLQLKRPIAEDRSRPDFLKAGFVSSNIITIMVVPEMAQLRAPLTLVLTGPESFVSGDDVSVNAVIANISDQPIYLVTNADGVLEDMYYHLKTTVGPNGAIFYGRVIASDRQVIHTISPGATFQVKIDQRMLGVNAAWAGPRTYLFQLIYSATSNLENNFTESNIIATHLMRSSKGDAKPLRP